MRNRPGSPKAHVNRRDFLKSAGAGQLAPGAVPNTPAGMKPIRGKGGAS